MLSPERVGGKNRGQRRLQSLSVGNGDAGHDRSRSGANSRHSLLAFISSGATADAIPAEPPRLSRISNCDAARGRSSTMKPTNSLPAVVQRQRAFRHPHAGRKAAPAWWPALGAAGGRLARSTGSRNGRLQGDCWGRTARRRHHRSRGRRRCWRRRCTAIGAGPTTAQRTSGRDRKPSRPALLHQPPSPPVLHRVAAQAHRLLSTGRRRHLAARAGNPGDARRAGSYTLAPVLLAVVDVRFSGGSSISP